MKEKIIILGHGFVGQHFAALYGDQFEIIKTSRSQKQGFLQFSDDAVDDQLLEEIKSADYILSSIPPNEKGDPAFLKLQEEIKASSPKWIGYLSTTGVYGDHQGGKVDEETPLKPESARAVKRMVAEEQWQSLKNDKCSINIFRLPGIYGKGRSAFDAIRAGRNRMIDKRLKNGAPHFFCRAHADDIAQVIFASMKKSPTGANDYNVADDQPEPSWKITKFAHELMGLEIPDLVAEKDADLSPMAKSFYRECKHILNDKIKSELGVKLKYPNYQVGLAAIFEQERDEKIS